MTGPLARVGGAVGGVRRVYWHGDRLLAGSEQMPRSSVEELLPRHGNVPLTGTGGPPEQAPVLSAGPRVGGITVLGQLEGDIDDHVLLPAHIPGLPDALQDVVGRHAVPLGRALGM